MKLGLSKYEAMVYSALTSLGRSEVADISKMSRVARTKVYEVLD
jgi:sugar-specific transcriptional regulator TrmB